MWPKNIIFYRTDAELPLAGLDITLKNRPHNPPLGLDWFSEGWAPPFAHDPDYFNQELRNESAQLITLQRSDKVLPAGVIRDLLDEKIRLLEDQEIRKVGRKEKQNLKEIITDDLLPKAFTRDCKINGYLDFGNGLVMIDTASVSKAENFLSTLRDALPAFPAKLPHVSTSPQSAMTEWLVDGEAPGPFELDRDCELRSPGDSASAVKYKNQDLTSPELQEHLKRGKQAIRLGLVWKERIRFTLTEQLTLRRIQFLDVIQEEAAQADADDMPSLMHSTHLLVKEELAALIRDLVQALGGYQE